MWYLFSRCYSLLDDLSDLPLPKRDEPIIVPQNKFIILEKELNKDIIIIISPNEEYVIISLIKSYRMVWSIQS